MKPLEDKKTATFTELTILLFTISNNTRRIKILFKFLFSTSTSSSNLFQQPSNASQLMATDDDDEAKVYRRSSFQSCLYCYCLSGVHRGYFVRVYFSIFTKSTDGHHANRNVHSCSLNTHSPADWTGLEWTTNQTHTVSISKPPPLLTQHQICTQCSFIYVFWVLVWLPLDFIHPRNGSW